MAKLFRHIGDLLRGKPKAAAPIIPPYYPPQPEPLQASVAPPAAAKSAEPSKLREPSVAAEPAVPREPPVPGP